MSSDLQDVLGKKSSLTNTQIQSLLLQKSVRKGDLTVKEALKKRARDGRDAVTPGAYYRVLSQTRSNIEESLYTLLLCSRLKVLQTEDLRRLLDTIAKVPSDLDEQTSQEVTSLIDALVRRIVIL
jgi:hypothetical protein